MMLQIDKILQYNKSFVENKEYVQYETSKYPDRHLLIVTCMDTRLTELLPHAIGIKNGDAQVVKTAGAVITNPYGSEMRSILVGIYDMGVKEIIVIGHDDCGMQGLKSDKLINEMRERGIDEKHLDSHICCETNMDSWLTGFENVEEAVRKSVDIIKNHPLIPEGIIVNGLVIDPKTGALRRA